MHLWILRLIIELPWLNENCKSQAKYAYKKWGITDKLAEMKTTFYQETLYRSERKS